MKTCTIEGCDKPHKARGMCNMHYNRLNRYGSLELQRPPIECGTPRGYDRHRKRGETTCQPCRDAIAAEGRRRRAEARALRPPKPVDYTAGTCTDCQRPMVKRRTPKELIPDGHIRARNKDLCVTCYVTAFKAAHGEPVKRKKPTTAPVEVEVKPVDPTPELIGWMRRREERLAREARRKRAAQILANQGRRPAA